MVLCLFVLCDTEAMFTKSVPSTMKMTVKGGAAVDPDSGIAYSLTYCLCFTDRIHHHLFYHAQLLS